MFYNQCTNNGKGVQDEEIAIFSENVAALLEMVLLPQHFTSLSTVIPQINVGLTEIATNVVADCEGAPESFQILSPSIGQFKLPDVLMPQTFFLDIETFV